MRKQLAWIPLLALPTTALAQQAPTRTVTATDLDVRSEAHAPGVVSGPYQTFFEGVPGAGSVSVCARVDFDLPQLAGVRHIRHEQLIRAGGRADIEWTGLGPETVVSATLSSSTSACDPSTCTWGYSDYGVQGSFLSNNFAPTAAGETGAHPFSALLFGFFSFDPFTASWSITPSNTTQWMSMQLRPSMQVCLDFTGLEVTARDPNGAVIPVQYDRVAHRLFAELTVINTFELDPVPMTPYCTSPPSSSGQQAELEAYGSPTAGDNWFTVRATGLPADTTALLFAGTAPANMPGATANVCVGGAVTRETGAVAAAGDTADFDVDLTLRAPGETVYFQAFFRDPLLGFAATDASSVTIQ